MVPDLVPDGVHQGLESLDGIHGRVLRVDVHGLDQVHVQRLVEQDHVPVFHGDGPGAPGGVLPAQELGEAGEGGIRSIVVVGRITIADVGGGIVRRVKFRGDRRHLLQENLPGVDAGVLVVDEQADGEGTVCVPLCDLGDDRGGLIGGVQPAQEDLIGAVLVGVDHLPRAVVVIHPGPGGKVLGGPCQPQDQQEDQHREGPAQGLPPSYRWRRNILPLVDAPGAEGAEGGLLRQLRAAVGACAPVSSILLHVREPPSAAARSGTAFWGSPGCTG